MWCLAADPACLSAHHRCPEEKRERDSLTTHSQLPCGLQSTGGTGNSFLSCSDGVEAAQALMHLPLFDSKCPALQGKRLFGVCSVFWESWATTGPEWKEGLLDSKANCEEMSKLIEEGDLGQDWVIAKTRGDCMRPLYTIIMDVAGLSAVRTRPREEKDPTAG